MRTHRKFTLMRSSVAMALLVCMSFAAAQEGVMSRQHDEWISGALVGARPVRFRALVERLESGAYTNLIIDLLEGDCQKRFVSLNVLLADAIDDHFLSEEQSATLRVDQYPQHALTYRLATLPDRRTLGVFVMGLEGEDAFWKEMASARFVRFRFRTERKDYYLRFALNGYRAALNRAIALCRAPPGSDDKSYFAK